MQERQVKEQQIEYAKKILKIQEQLKTSLAQVQYVCLVQLVNLCLSSGVLKTKCTDHFLKGWLNDYRMTKIHHATNSHCRVPSFSFPVFVSFSKAINTPSIPFSPFLIMWQISKEVEEIQSRECCDVTVVFIPVEAISIAHLQWQFIYLAVNFWFQLILKFNQLVFSN